MERDINKEREKETGEIEIDLLDIARKLWGERRFIVKITIGFAIFGLFIAIFSPKEYSSQTTLVPQIGDTKNKVGGNLAGLAAMAVI